MKKLHNLVINPTPHADTDSRDLRSIRRHIWDIPMPALPALLLPTQNMSSRDPLPGLTAFSPMFPKLALHDTEERVCVQHTAGGVEGSWVNCLRLDCLTQEGQPEPRTLSQALPSRLEPEKVHYLGAEAL